MTLTTLGYAFIGGLLPAFIWLYFLLKEDSRCPEPKAIIALAFVAGMIAVVFTIPIEKYVQSTLTTGSLLTAWALIEEVLKYGAAALFILWRPAVDEAPDYVIYMITVALGFAAAENMLFLLTPFASGQVAAGIFTSDMRFIGSNLLHVIASATIGFSLAFSSKSTPHVRLLMSSGGLILAIALHTAFNALIMTQGASTTITALFLVWIAAVVFLATFEVLKYFQYRNLPSNTCQS